MALMKINEYRQRFTPASRPDPRTVKAWILRGELYGEKRGRDWYVDPDRAAGQAPEPSEKLSPLARRVLNGS